MADESSDLRVPPADGPAAAANGRASVSATLPLDVTVPDGAGPPGRWPLAGPAATGADASAAGVGRVTFTNDFRRFFVRGLATLMPTLVTLWLLTWLWNFLWTSIGQHVIFGIRWGWLRLVNAGVLEPTSAGDIRHRLNDDDLSARVLGVGLAVLLVYLVGVLVGNLIGRTFYRIGERAAMRLPLIRAIYPAVKQVTDFLLAERKQSHFAGSRVVAVQARTQGVWSIGFVTNSGYGPLNRATGGDMVTVFVPSTPTAFSGYVVVAHREATVDLPLTVEEAMRLLLSGGVIVPPPAGGGTAVGAATAEVAETVLPSAEHRGGVDTRVDVAVEPSGPPALGVRSLGEARG